MSNGTAPDPDDFFSETRMSFGDHIEELRVHLWRAVAGFGVALFVSFFFGHLVMDVITAPVHQEMKRFDQRRQVRVREQQKNNPEVNAPTPFQEALIPRQSLDAVVKGYEYQLTDLSLQALQPLHDAKNARALDEVAKLKGRTFDSKEEWLAALDKVLSPAEREILEPEILKVSAVGFLPPLRDIPEKERGKYVVKLPVSFAQPLNLAGDLQPATRMLIGADNLSTLNVQEAFSVWFKVCMVTGIVLGSPWIFWQIWMFVAAGLYPQERRLVHVYLPVSLFLFLAGVVLCEVFVIPKAIEALFWFNELMDLKPEMRLNEWLSFAIWMPVIFGASFQTPLVMLFLNRLGIMDIDAFRNRRRMAWFAMAIFAAIITPSTDALSMLFLWVPMSLLFELGILLIRFTPNKPSLDVEAPEPDEMVEV